MSFFFRDAWEEKPGAIDANKKEYWGFGPNHEYGIKKAILVSETSWGLPDCQEFQ